MRARERAEPEAEVDDGAARREITAGVRVLRHDPPAPGKGRLDAGADTVAVVPPGRSGQAQPQVVLVGLPRAEKERFGRLHGADEDVERAVAVGVEGDGGPAVRLEIEAVEKSAILEERRTRAGPAAVVEVPVALDAVDAGALAVEGPGSRHVVVPVGERLPPELELDVAVAPVAPESVGGVEVGPAVVVEVGGDRAPVPAGVTGPGAGRRVLERVVRPLEEQRVARGHVLAPADGRREKDAAPEGDGNRRVLVEEVPLRVRARRVDVGPAVAVVVRPRARHAVRAGERAGLLRHVLESPAEVAVEVLQAEVVGRHEILAAVLVIVLEEGGERPARFIADSPGLRRVGEAAMAVVQIENIRAPVLRVEGRVRHLAVVIARDRDEEIEVPVAVDVGERRGSRVGGHGDSGVGRRLLERPVAAVAEEPRRTERVGHEDVGVPVAVDVARREPGGGNALRGGFCQAGLLRDVREAAGAVAAVKDRAHAVADEEVLGAVAVVVEHGDARARPEVGDEVVDLVDRRITPRRAEAGSGGGVAKSRRGLRCVRRAAPRIAWRRRLLSRRPVRGPRS